MWELLEKCSHFAWISCHTQITLIFSQEVIANFLKVFFFLFSIDVCWKFQVHNFFFRIREAMKDTFLYLNLDIWKGNFSRTMCKFECTRAFKNYSNKLCFICKSGKWIVSLNRIRLYLLCFPYSIFMTYFFFLMKFNFAKQGDLEP